MPSSFQNLVNRTLKVEPREIPAAALSFLFAFSLMAAYYVLRPVRDAMSSDWTDAELSWLWTLNFFISAAAVLLYGFVVSRIELKKLVPGIYIFFAASFMLFYLATLGLSDTGFIDKSFYVWVSFFALFHISVFWSFMSDITRRRNPCGYSACLAPAPASARSSVPPCRSCWGRPSAFTTCC